MRNSQNERGSMFLVALIALSVLTLVGLSLAMVTETEMILGSNEWVVTETHFAAEAGINLTMAQMLVSSDPSPVDFVLPSYFGRLDGRNQIGFTVKSAGFRTIEKGALPYSTANFGDNAPQYNYGYTTVRSQRTAWSQGKDVPDCSDTEQNVLGQKFLTTALYIAPMEGQSSAESLLAAERAATDDTVCNQFLCQWECDRNKDPDLTDETNVQGTVNDVLTRANPFYYGYTSGS